MWKIYNGVDKTIKENADLDKMKYVIGLKTLKKIFEKHNIMYWIDYGTLWGAIRDNAIMKFESTFMRILKRADLKSYALSILGAR